MSYTRSLLRPLLLVGALLAAGAQAAASVDSPLAEQFSVVAGQTITATLRLSNPDDQPTTLRLTRSDYSFSANGEVRYDPPGSLPRSNASWIELPSQVTLPARGKLELPYLIHVPASAGQTGTYWSALLVEPVTPATTGGAVRQVLRYAVQLATTFGDSGRTALAFSGPALTRGEDGRLTFQAELHNEGERFARAHVYAELYDAGGVKVQTIEGETRRTYPGTSVRERFTFTPPAGRGQLLVFADAGDGQVFGARYALGGP